MSNDQSPLDRDLQLKLLQALQACFPSPLRDRPSFSDGDEKAIDINVTYLAGHDLCDIDMHEQMGGRFRWVSAKITSAGLDFLADDGGLSVILKAVTVRFEGDTIRDLIAAKIEASSIPRPEKSKLMAQLSTLPGAALRLAASDLMKRGLDHLPEVLDWMRSLHGI